MPGGSFSVPFAEAVGVVRAGAAGAGVGTGVGGGAGVGSGAAWNGGDTTPVASGPGTLPTDATLTIPPAGGNSGAAWSEDCRPGGGAAGSAVGSTAVPGTFAGAAAGGFDAVVSRIESD